MVLKPTLNAATIRERIEQNGIFILFNFICIFPNRQSRGGCDIIAAKAAIISRISPPVRRGA